MLIACSDVAYVFPKHSASQSTPANERSTALYLTKHGPVYSRAPISSAVPSGGKSTAASSASTRSRSPSNESSVRAARAPSSRSTSSPAALSCPAAAERRPCCCA